MEVTSRVSLRELYDMYVDLGSKPPEWVARAVGMPDGPRLEGDALNMEAVSSGIPSLFAVADPDFDTLKALDNGSGLYICGRQGTGKTWLASRVAKAWMASGMGRVRFISSVRLMSEISDTYGSRFESESQVISRYASCPLLVVDDLGKEVPSQWALSKLFALFDDRYANKRSTIVTTQFSPDALARRMATSGDAETAMAIVSRFRERYRSVAMGNVDRRAGM